MGRLSDDRDLLTRLRAERGFEYALEEVRREYKRVPIAEYEARLNQLQHAISDAFDEMNAAFETRASMEFDTDPRYWIQTFLARFDAIFTLNQDLLLERLYKPENVTRHSEWAGWHLPGMSYLEPEDGEEEMWVPDAREVGFERRPNVQPVFKLHGSVKWHDQ